MKRSRYTLWFYALTPVLAMAVFAWRYTDYQHAEHIRVTEQSRLQDEAAARKEQEQREMEARLEQEAAALAAAREQARLEKEAREDRELATEWDNAQQRLQDLTNNILRYRQQLAEGQDRLQSLRSERQTLDAEVEQLSRARAQLAAQKSAANLESERLTDMLVTFIRREWTPTTPPTDSR